MRIPHSGKEKSTFYIILLLGIFIVSRVLYDQVGVPFLGDTYRNYWQFIHPSLLRTDLWRSILYLHSQPPLFNVLTGAILQIFPAHAQAAFHILYFLEGVLLAVSIYLLGIYLQLPRWLSLLAAALFTVSPPTIIYEHWFMYGYLIASGLAVAGVALYRFAESQKIGWGIVFFSLLASVALTWTLFHLVWLIALFVLMLALFQDRRKVVLAALIPLLLVFGWYAKNLLVFGEFSAGSWSGMNLSRMTTFRLPEKEREQMIKEGTLSPFAEYPPFRNPDVYLRLLPDTPVTGIPVLDIAEFPGGVRNHHHQVYLEATKYYLRDALYILRVRPTLYLRAVWQAVYIFFHSASDFELTSEIRRPIYGLDVWWNRIFYGQWLNDESSTERLVRISPLHMGWGIVVAFLLGVVCTLRYFWKNSGEMRQPGGLLLLFMLFNILYVSFVGNSLDIGENNRFRYVIDAFLLLLAFHSLYEFLLSGQSKLIHTRT
jgi:hypothetical protein